MARSATDPAPVGIPGGESSILGVVTGGCGSGTCSPTGGLCLKELEAIRVGNTKYSNHP